jgi:hypothetical protein
MKHRILMLSPAAGFERGIGLSQPVMAGTAKGTEPGRQAGSGLANQEPVRIPQATVKTARRRKSHMPSGIVLPLALDARARAPPPEA